MIELSIALAVLVTLALVLTPSITNFVNDSRIARAHTETQTVAAALARFYKDNGFYPQWTTTNAGGPGTAAARRDLLVGPGNTPTVATPNLWTTGTSDTIANQLMTNTPAYAVKTAGTTHGWSGPYLSTAIGADPWSNRYMVNIGMIDSTTGDQTAADQRKNAVWVISAGPDGQIETASSQSITDAVIGGDDIAVRVQ